MLINQPVTSHWMLGMHKEKGEGVKTAAKLDSQHHHEAFGGSCDGLL